MKSGAWITSLVFAGIMVGCTLPSDVTPPPTAIASLTAAIPATTTAIMLPPSVTPVHKPVYATGKSAPVNCRYGPGTIYEVIGRLDAGQTTRVSGRDHTGDWLYIHDPLNPGGFCWVSLSPVDIEGELGSLPVTDPPYVTVKRVDVHAEPQRVTVSCDNYPQYALFVAEVTASGPTLVNWRWELSTGEVTEPQVLLFDQAGSQTLQKGIVLQSPNDYWGRLHINSPNEIVGQVNLVANCTP